MRSMLLEKGIVVLTPSFKTHTLEGVEQCGYYLMEFMKQNIPKNVTLYLYGHSFGGVYLRRALVILSKEKWFGPMGITVKLFMTTASPHLGTMHYVMCNLMI